MTDNDAALTDRSSMTPLQQLLPPPLPPPQLSLSARPDDGGIGGGLRLSLQLPRVEPPPPRTDAHAPPSSAAPPERASTSAKAPPWKTRARRRPGTSREPDDARVGSQLGEIAVGGGAAPSPASSQNIEDARTSGCPFARPSNS